MQLKFEQNEIDEAKNNFYTNKNSLTDEVQIANSLMQKLDCKLVNFMKNSSYSKMN